MQEDSKKNTQVPTTTELSATERDESIARITAELLQACDSAPKAVKKEKATPVAAQPKETAPAKKNAVLEKEISSATPDKSVEVSQAIANNLLENDEGVRPFRQGDEIFKNFFTTTAVVLPKDMQDEDDAAEKPAVAQERKPSLFARLQGVFARKSLIEDDDEEEDDGVFFPEEVALERAFPRRPAAVPAQTESQAPIDETLQFDLALTQKESTPRPAPQGDAPKGKVRFLQPEPAAQPLEPVQGTPAPVLPPKEIAAQKEASPTPEKQQAVQRTEEIILTPLSAAPEEQVEAPEETSFVPPVESTFEDLSAETAFLLEDCEVQTVRKETIFTVALAKVQGWKESLQVKYEELKLQHATAKAAKQAAEEAEIDAQIDEMMLGMHPEEAGDDAQTVALVDDAQESVRVLPQESDDFFVQATTEAPADAFFTDATEPDTAAQAEPSPVAPVAPDPLLASVHSAFAARGGQAPVSDASLLDAFDTPLSAAQEAPAVAAAPTEQPAEEIVAEATEEMAQPAAQEVAADVAAACVQEVAKEITEEIVQEVVAQPAQEALEGAAVAAAIAPAAPDAQVDAPDPTLPSGVCLFDQAADEAAAEAQLGEITFVGAPAPAAHEIDPFVQDVRAPEDITLDWMPDAAEQAPPAASAPEETPLLDDTLLADIAQGTAQEAPYVPPFEDAPKAEHEPLPEDPEGIQFGLTGMRVKLLVRTFTTAVFAAALFLLGLMAQGVVPTIGAIDPISAPVPFLLVNLLLLLAAAGVSYPIFIEGITGLWRKPSPDTLPAIATIAALLQLLLCLTLVDSYDATAITLFSALAGLVLFADALGSLVMAQVIQANFSLASAGVPHFLAYRVQGKDTQRALTRGLEVDAPALLVSRPVQQMEGFLEKSFSGRASDRRAQWVAYGLLGGAVLAYLIAMLKGQGAIGAISSFAAVLCIGAPFSVTLLAALPSVFLQRAAAKVGAVVPGWQSIESLGDINLLAVQASDLFPPLCAQLHGIKTFQKERVDLAILYATSMLMEGCDTLQNLFAGMIDYKQDMLYPVKDLVHRKGLGFVGWCENYRVILGTRALMQAEGVPLPALDYENRYSKDGKRQILYLSVSGQLYAMFIIGYRGEKSVAHALRTLRKERIRLLVNCSDPTLTARRIEEIYRLPAGFITLLSTEQAGVMQGATSYRPRAEGCLLHLGNFASLVGGMRAASGAAQAEQAASAIQLVWAGFSILLCLFLCITGGLMQVALVAILLYQLAWCVLNLGVVFTKKFE